MPRDESPAAGWRLEALVPTLLVVSYVYLVLPYLIFFLGWLRWWLAAPAVALLVVASYYAVRNVFPLDPSADTDGERAVVRWHQLLLLVVVATALSSISGAGGYGVQESDYVKHNPILKYLVEQRWPAMAESDRDSFPLVYYIAWYLPAAMVGKVTGWVGANHFLQLWTAIGLVLSLLWFGVLCQRLTWIIIGVFVFFSGLDIVGASLFMFLDWAADPGFTWRALHPSGIDWTALRWWNWNWQLAWWNERFLRTYPSNVSHLFFAPQQALAGWILAGIAAYTTLRDSYPLRRTLIFLFALSCLWSPFVTIGLAPLVLFDFLSVGLRDFRQTKVYVSVPNFLGLGIIALMFLFYLSRFSELPLAADPVSRFRIGSPRLAFGTEFLATLVVFYLLEVGIIAFFVWWIGSIRHEARKRLLAATLLFLFVLPFFQYGALNDLVMRVSIPSLFVFAAFVARAASDEAMDRTRKLMLIGILAIAATSPTVDIYRHLRGLHAQGRIVAIPGEEEFDSLWEVSCRARNHTEEQTHPLAMFHGDTLFRQYVGSNDSLFFRYLARQHPATRAPTD